MYDKRIVIDLDDTISVTHNRDFKNAQPQLFVIAKVNELYNQGYEIVILTARGQLSCKGDHKKAEAKYRHQIETWLKENGVKYHELSFNKILAKYYIDDKNLSIGQFVNLEEKPLTKGKSGAEVILGNGFVYKTHKGIHDEVAWYSLCDKLSNKPFSIPFVHSVIGDTVCMSYVKELMKEIDINYKYRKLKNNIEIILQFFKLTKDPCSEAHFSTYINRVFEHVNKNNLKIDRLKLSKELLKILKYMNENTTFNHGDLTLDNILYKGNNETFLIDSIYNNALYSSYIIDAGKLLYDLELKEMLTEADEFIRYCSQSLDIPRKVLKLIELTHWIRVLTYIKTPKERNWYTRKINQKYKQLCF